MRSSRHSAPALVTIALSCATAHGAIVYVDDDAPAGGDGTTWASAFRFLQDAFAVATAGTDIRVAQGVYKPDRDEANPNGTGDRSAVFRLATDLVVGGGFLGLSAGKGEDPNEHDVEAYVTILDGDLLGDDGLAGAGKDENSYRLINGIAGGGSAVVEGFLITGGNANDEEDDRVGGGMYLNAGEVLILDCTFRGNAATFGGGGVYLADTSVTAIGSVFEDNLASNSGGVAATGSGSRMFVDCVVRNNTVGGHGGGLALSGAATLIGCTVSGNSSGTGDGGGLTCEGPLTLVGCDFIANMAGDDPHAASRGGGVDSGSNGVTAVDCRFIGNEAESGGGIHTGVQTFTEIELIRCVFQGNSAVDGGGAIITRGQVYVADCIFDSNTASDQGGGLHISLTVAPFVNCRFHSNAAPFGGGVYNSGFPTLSNCSFFGNQGDFGGGIFNASGAIMELNNSILWHDGGGEIIGNVSVVRYSLVEGGYPGVGILDEDPRFVNPVGGDLHLLSDSPCIDAGHNWLVHRDERDLDDDGDDVELTPLDIDDNPRFVGDVATGGTRCGVPRTVDLGAYEFAGDDAGPVYFADIDADGVFALPDLLIVLVEWGLCDGCCPADLNVDGSVSTPDLLAMLTSWSPG